MLVVDENKLKLLKMKEKLLEVSPTVNNTVLEEYKQLATEIVNEEYNTLISKIKKNDYNKLPLEEQIRFLSEIEDNYNSLNELEWGYRNIYQKHANNELPLPSLDNILIDNIREKISAIQGYLLNNKNLESNKVELENLNSELISAHKRKELAQLKVAEIEDIIKENFLKAEGRIYNDVGGLEYTSTVLEYQKASLNLNNLVNNPKLLEDELVKANKEKEENNETLSAALICYNENDEKNRDVFEKIKKAAKNSEYKVILLEIVREICQKYGDYDLVINKFASILNLIETRKMYLKLNFYIDPFDRIRIEEQLDVVKALEKTVSEIADIRKTIAFVSSTIDDMENVNIELLSRINENTSILNDVKEENKGDITINENKPLEVDIKNIAKNIIIKDNQVVKINNINDNFMFERVREKTNGVINRVNELLNGEKINDSIEIIPELVIENEQTNENNITIDNNEEISFLEPITNIADTKKQDEIFVDLPFIENEQEKDTNEEINETKEKEIPISIASSLNEDDLFEEVTPFKETSLFDDRYDDEVFNNDTNMSSREDTIPIVDSKNENDLAEETTNEETIKDNTEMPEVFWPDNSQESTLENINDENEKSSIDVSSFYDSLISGEDETKVRKRVA